MDRRGLLIVCTTNENLDLFQKECSYIINVIIVHVSIQTMFSQ